MNDRYIKAIQLFKDNADSSFSANPATEKEIDNAETKLGVKFPESYKKFQLEFGDFDWGILEIHSVKKQENGISIASIALSEQTECHPNMPNHLVPFSSNGGGDSYCFDTSNFLNKECPVVFWDHTESENQTAEIVAKDFIQWIINEIEWKIEEDAD